MFSNKRLNALKSIKSLDPSFYCAGVVGEFISLYLLNEVFAKKLQNYYRIDNKKPELDKIQTQVLTASLKHFSLIFNESDLKLIFKGGEGIVGKKSARQLRNGYLHSLSTTDKQEIISKAHTYNNLMRDFLVLCKQKNNNN